MTLHLIGIGLSDEKDISVRGLETIKKCSKIYLESYTSLMQASKEQLEKFYGKKIILANRQQTENNMQQILDEAKKEEIALLIIGDVFSATTHINYSIECKKQNISLNIVHNASILTAVGEIGLELYKYGKVTSVPFADSTTPITVIESNKQNNLHTLVLLDLDTEKKKFITIAEAIERLNIAQNETIVGCARIGCNDARIVACNKEEMRKTDFGNPPYCIVIPAPKLHFVEEEALQLWKTT